MTQKQSPEKELERKTGFISSQTLVYVKQNFS